MQTTHSVTRLASKSSTILQQNEVFNQNRAIRGLGAAFSLSRTSGLISSCPAFNFRSIVHPRPSPTTIVAKAGGDKNSQETSNEGGNGSIIGSIGLFVFYAAIVAYAFVLSPNQTPYRDMYFLEKLVGLGVDDGVPINAVFTQLFFIMGFWPLIYSALLIPGGKSGNGIPAWPFVSLSFGFGAFGLVPYMALWQPPKEDLKLPPSKEDMEGTGNIMLRGMESPFLAIGLLGGAVFCLYQAFTAGTSAWNEYFKLFQESRFVHVTSIDFMLLTSLAPFWMYNDAQLRNWGPRDSLVPLFSVLPVVGPALYLVLRPKGGAEEE